MIASTRWRSIGEDPRMHQDAGRRGSGELVDELIAALNAHDATAAGELMTVDAEYICWSGDAWATTHGAEAIVRLIDGYDRELGTAARSGDI